MANPNEPEEVAELNPAIASQMLSNIFDACDYEANTVPLEVISNDQNFYREKNYLQRGLIILILIALLLLPILFLTPHITMEQRETAPGEVAVTVRYDCPLPIDRIVAGIDDHPVAITETQDGVFEIIPDRNGKLHLEITLINHQSAMEELAISKVDKDPPELIRSVRGASTLTIYFKDASGSLNYEEAFAMNSRGETIRPLRYDEDAMSITFPFPGEALNIFVEDGCGNALQLMLSVW